MTLSFENLGVIKKGELNLDKDLIILTGPNNTGKSYLTYLIHAIHNSNYLLGKGFDIHGTILKDIVSSEEIKSSIEEQKSVRFNEFVNHHSGIFNKLIDDAIKNNLVRIFASAKINPTVNVQIKNFDFYQASNKKAIGFDVIDQEIHPVFTDGSSHKASLEVFQGKYSLHTLAAHFTSAIISNFLENNAPFGKSYIFPAERTAINLFARDIISKKAGARDEMALRVLSGEDIQDIARSITQEQNTTPKYPLAINDYINFVNNFDGSTSISKFNNLAQEIESSIMGGNISVSEFKQLLFQPTGTNQTLNLHEASSLIKSLSFLVVYLRHFATKGDWVIIDEPEINLHPNLQVAIARVFARMVNAGLKVIISTHSDYLIKEINTLLMLHDLYEDKKQRTFIKQHGYSTSELINKQQVEAYYLNNGKIACMDVESNGIFVPSIDKTIASIDNFTEEIFFKLKSSKASKTPKRVKSNELK